MATGQREHFEFHGEAEKELSPAEYAILEERLRKIEPESMFRITDLTEDGQEIAIHEAAYGREIGAEQTRYASFGTVVKPSEETLYGYKFVLLHAEEIRFSPDTYGLFDGIIARECGADTKGRFTHPAFRSGPPSYSEYAPLRRNLAILRDYLLVHNPPEGKQGPGNIAKMQVMARELSNQLRVVAPAPSGFIARLIDAIMLLLGKTPPKSSNRFLDQANVPDHGIAFMYVHLLKFQDSPAFLTALPPAQAPRDWKMLPQEQSPFSGENLRKDCDSSEMGRIADAFEIVTQKKADVSEMELSEKEISVQHARDILENMKVVFSGSEEKKMDVQDPVIRKAKLILKVAISFRKRMSLLSKQDKSVEDDPEIQQASDSIAKISFRVRQEEIGMLKDDNRTDAAKSAAAKANRHAARARTGEPMPLLLQRLDQGLNRLDQLERRQPGRLREAGTVSRNRDQNRDVGRQAAALRGVQDGMFNTMSEPRITQVSNPKLVEAARQMNEAKPEVQQPQKSSTTGISKG